MKRTGIIVAVIAVLAVGGYFLWQESQANQERAFEILREAAVQRGVVEATVNAAGSIEPEALVSLTFGVAGAVQQVNVARGQYVEKGQILATLEADELALAVKQAEDALRIQELTLEQRLNSQPTPATLAGAQADVDSALASLQVAQANLASAEAGLSQAQAQRAQLLAGATTAEIAAAEAEIAARNTEVLALQRQYDQIIQAGVGGAAEEQTRFQLNAARQALIAAEARLAVLEAGPRLADIQAANAAVSAAEAQVSAAEGNVAVAEASVARARAAYDRLLEEPAAADIAILEAQVASAQTSLELAQLRLEQAMIIAPISGRVANLRINPGEQAAPGAVAISIVNEEAFHIEVNVDEIDIDRVAIGQAVEIALDALPNSSVAGVVADISPTPSGTGGIVTYMVTINIDEPEIPLRPGMSANANIVVEQIEEALYVPNWAIRLDRETGAAYVNRLRADGQIEEVPIEIGLRNEQVSQALSGLSEGDRVVVTTERQTFSFFGN